MLRSRHSMRITGKQWDEVLALNSTGLYEMLQDDIASALSVTRSQVYIASVTIGSLIVEFIVTRNASQSLSDDRINTAIAAGLLPLTYGMYHEETGSNETLSVSLTFTVKSSTDPANNLACGVTCISAVVAGVAAIAVLIFATWRIATCLRNRKIIREQQLREEASGAWYRRTTQEPPTSRVRADFSASVFPDHQVFPVREDLPDCCTISVENSDDDQRSTDDWDKTSTVHANMNMALKRHQKYVQKYFLSEPVEYDVNAAPDERSNSSYDTVAIAVKDVCELQNGGDTMSREPFVDGPPPEDKQEKTKKQTKKKKKKKKGKKDLGRNRSVSHQAASPDLDRAEVCDVDESAHREQLTWALDSDIPEHVDMNFDEVYSSDFEPFNS